MKHRRQLVARAVLASRWEERLRHTERDLRAGFTLFSADWDVLDDDVARSLAAARNQGGLTKLYNAAVLNKPSVSKAMTALSVFFAAVWIVAALGSLVAA